jgi:putative transposase
MPAAVQTSGLQALTGWESSSNLAGVMGRSPKTVKRRAQAEGWETRRGQVNLDSLPAWRKEQLATQNRQAVATSNPEPAEVEAFNRASDEDRAKAVAKAEVLDAWLAWRNARKAEGILKGDADKSFLESYRSRTIPDLPLEVYDLAPFNSVSWLEKNEKARSKGGLAALLPGKSTGRPPVALAETDRNLILGQFALNPDLRARHAHKLLQADRIAAGGKKSDAPSYPTVWRFLKDFREKNPSLCCYLDNPDKWKSEFQIALGNAADIARHFNHVVELDSTPADMLDADGRRLAVIGGIDVFSRVMMLQFYPTSSAEGILHLLRRWIRSYGVPSMIRTDCGKDYTSKRLRSVCRLLEIHIIECPPFTPEKKPFVERGFRTFSMFAETCPGFVGHSVGQQQARRARRSFADRLMGRGKDKEPIVSALTRDELQNATDQWLRNTYHQERHGGIGVPPVQKMASCKEPRGTFDERVLDLLLAEAGERAVGKKGIRFQGLTFWNDDLIPFIGKEQRVSVRWDPNDASQIFVFDSEGSFVCTAQDLAASGKTPAEFKEIKKKNLKNVREEAKALKKLGEGRESAIFDVLTGGLATEGGTVVAFRRSEEAEVEHMEEFRRAAAAAEGRSVVEVEDDVQEGNFGSFLEKYRWLQSEVKQRPLTEEERLWIHQYEDSELCETNFQAAVA